MKFSKKILIVGCFLFGNVLQANAQQTNKKVIEIESTLKEFQKAMIDSDSSKLNALTASELTYGHSTGKIQNKSEFLQSFVTGATNFVTISTTDQDIKLFGNTAVVHHILSADTNDNQKPGHTDLKILLVWHKEGKSWKLITRQAVKFK